MMVLLDFPCIVKHYAGFFQPCFSAEGFEHFQKAVSGIMVSDNKTLEAINRLFVLQARNQSSFNRFFNRQNFDLEQVNEARLAMLQHLPGTRFKSAPGSCGVLSVDSTLLMHYGKHFDDIYYHYDYTHKCHRWAHDLVTLHYSDDETDYPVYYRLWRPPDWEEVARFFKKRGFTINATHWARRQEEKQKWLNYIRARYKVGRKKYPQVVELYQTKNHIAAELIGKFCAAYAELHLPIALDGGFTSAELCARIEQEFQRDYVGTLREDQHLLRAGNQKQQLSEFVAELKADHANPNTKPVFHKVGYAFKGQKQIAYAYCGNHRIKGFEKKQRLLIAFSNEKLEGRPLLMITNRLNWYPSAILRIRRHRWPVETYHQEGKAEGLQQYQVRNLKAIQAYLAFVVVTYSMLKCATHDPALLSTIQQRLQTETEGPLPFLRRLMKVESLWLLIEYLFMMYSQGHPLEHSFQALVSNMTYA